jgi:hypothetical protein
MVAVLAGCGAAEQAVDQAAGQVTARAEREATCVQWRVVQELVERRDDPRIAELVDGAVAQMNTLVSEEQRATFADALDRARDVAAAAGEEARLVTDGADQALIEEATAVTDEARATFEGAVSGIETYCVGTLSAG